MISEICYSPEWLEKKRKEIKADPGLLERALHAFALLGHLAESDLEFVFKGGTSLLLHVPVIRRLSIDIDILCASIDGELDKILAEVAKVPPFTGYEEDERGARGLPNRRHFKFFYNPIVKGNPNPHVFLDVVEEARIPHEVIKKNIEPELLHIEKEIPVNVPTVESLLADKLTAFAPRTTGVPFQPKNGRPADTMQIVKQLFDVGELFELADDLSVVRKVYKECFDLENEYRETSFAPGDALEDTIGASLSLSMHNLKQVPDSEEALLLVDGVQRLASHIVNHNFRLDAAKLAAAKEAMCARLIQAPKAGDSLADLRNLPDPAVLKEMAIDGDWNKLNRLKNISPAAFYFWYRTSTI